MTQRPVRRPRRPRDIHAAITLVMRMCIQRSPSIPRLLAALARAAEARIMLRLIANQSSCRMEVIIIPLVNRL